jgi:hypothetical protein
MRVLQERLHKKTQSADPSILLAIWLGSPNIEIR